MQRKRFREIAAAMALRSAGVFLVGLCFMAVAAVQPQAGRASAPAVCPAGQQAVTLHLSDFENVAATLAAWRARPLDDSTGQPGANGRLAASHWHFPPPAPGAQPWSGSMNLWADLPSSAAMPRPRRSESAIETTSALPLPAGTRLSFIHRFDFSALPGTRAMVEYSLDDGLLWREIGGFSGSVDGLRSSHFDLSAQAGVGLRLRFRIVTPGATASVADSFRGWAVDDIHLYSCSVLPAATVDGQGQAGEEARRVGTSPVSIAAYRQPRILRGRTQLRLRVMNDSRMPLRRLRVCFRAPRRLIAGSRCGLLKLLPAKSTAEVSFPITVLQPPAAVRRQRIGVAFIARRGQTTLAGARRHYVVAPGRDVPRRLRLRQSHEY